MYACVDSALRIRSMQRTASLSSDAPRSGGRPATCCGAAAVVVLLLWCPCCCGAAAVVVLLLRCPVVVVYTWHATVRVCECEWGCCGALLLLCLRVAEVERLAETLSKSEWLKVLRINRHTRHHHHNQHHHHHHQQQQHLGRHKQQHHSTTTQHHHHHNNNNNNRPGSPSAASLARAAAGTDRPRGK